jgi:hypothetical protein
MRPPRLGLALCRAGQRLQACRAGIPTFSPHDLRPPTRLALAPGRGPSGGGRLLARTFSTGAPKDLCACRARPHRGRLLRTPRLDRRARACSDGGTRVARMRREPLICSAVRIAYGPSRRAWLRGSGLKRWVRRARGAGSAHGVPPPCSPGISPPLATSLDVSEDRDRVSAREIQLEVSEMAARDRPRR